MKIGNRTFDTARKTYLMGILNVTPDSFSDGGRFNRLDAALRHAEEMVAEGANIIDIGGESTRPGHTPVSDQEEIDRIAPAVEAVKARLDVPVSIDTYKSAVAEAALQAGADLVNDIWGFRRDPEIAAVTARHGAACCLMHNRREAAYGDLLEDMLADLRLSVGLAREAGIPEDRIMVDPGIGFGKTYEMNLTVLHHLEVFRRLGLPVLLGTSRKSVIGLALDLPADERLEGTLVTTVLAVEKGCAFVRVHDVEANRRAIQMTEAILGR